MGIAFIGAVAGHVKQVSGGASQKTILEKVRKQIQKKFGSKGDAVVAGNMQVIEEGIQATQRVDYNAAALTKIDAKPAPIVLRNVSLSSSMCQSSGSSTCGLFDREYFSDMIATPFKEGTIGEAPVLPGTGLFMPAGSAGAKDKGLFRRTVPVFNAELCTGCMECTLVCPDAAIPNTVHDIHELLATGIAQLDATEAQRDAMRAQIIPMTEGIRDVYRQTKEERAFHEIVAEVAGKLPTKQANAARQLHQARRCARRLSGLEDAALLRRDGKGEPGYRRSLRQYDRSVEVHGLSRMRRSLRSGRPERSGTRTGAARNAADPLRIHEQDAEHAGALL